MNLWFNRSFKKPIKPDSFKARAGVLMLLFAVMMITATPVLADDNMFLEILRLFSKGAESVGGSEAMGNTGTALGAGACWLCPFFELIFDVANTLATAVSQKLADTFLLLLGVGVLFFLAFRVGKMLVSLQEVDLMQFLADIFKYLGRAMVASVLLTFSLSIFYYVISPVMQGTLAIGNIIFTDGAASQMTIVKKVRGVTDGAVELTVKCADAAQQADRNATTDDQAFSPGVKEALMCNLRQVSASLVSGMASGMFTAVYGLSAGPLNLMSPLIVVQGIILFLIFFVIFVSYPLKFIDAMFQLTFVVALMPMWVVLWVFPATAGYTKKAWEMFFGAVLTFFMTNVLAGLVLNVLDLYSFPDTMWDSLVNGNAKDFAGEFALGGFEFLSLIAMSVICLKMLGMGKNLAQAFGGLVPDLGLNSAMGSAVMSSTTTGINVAKTTKRMGEAAVGGLSKWGAATGAAVAKKADFDKRVNTAAKAMSKTGAQIAEKEAAGSYEKDSAYEEQRTRDNNMHLDDMLYGLEAKDQAAALKALNDKINADAAEQGLDANAENMQSLIAARQAKLDKGEDVLHDREAANARRRALLNKVKSGMSGKDAVNSTPTSVSNHTFKGDIVSHDAHSITTNFLNEKGQDQTNVYDLNGQLKESRVVTSRYLNGQPKTVQIMDENGALKGVREFQNGKTEEWTQVNTDGTTTSQTIDYNKDGSKIYYRKTTATDGTLVHNEQETLSMVKGDDGEMLQQRETVTVDLKNGVEHKRTEIGKELENGQLQVMKEINQTRMVTQGKQEKGSGLNVVSTVDYSYDDKGNLISGRTVNAQGEKTLRMYGTPDKTISGRGFSISDFTYDKKGHITKTDYHYFKREARQWF